jgi:hypothetical protein
MTDRQCLYHPKDVSRKRHSCRINRSGDGRHMAEDCMVRSTTNRCVLTDKRRVSRVVKKSQKPSAVSRSAKKLEKREQSQAKRDAVKLRDQEVKLAYDNSVEEARVKMEQARLRLRKAFGVRKNDPDTSEIRNQLNDMRDKARVAIYNQYKDEMKDFSSLYSKL